MKICVTADGDNLDARVDARFGRCKYFLFIDTDTMEYEAVENPYREAPQGAGVQSAQLVVNKGAKKIITEKIDDLHKLAKALLAYETLSGDEIKDLILKKLISTLQTQEMQQLVV